MAKLTGDMIKAGQRIWVRGYEGGHLGKVVPVELIIVTGEVLREGKFLQVAFINPEHHSNEVHISARDSGIAVVCLSDKGVRPFNYNDRATQIFTTKEEMQAAIDLWKGRNPNVLTEEGECFIKETVFGNELHY